MRVRFDDTAWCKYGIDDLAHRSQLTSCRLAGRHGADLRGAGAIEGVGLQDVSPSLQKLVVNVRDDVRAGDDQQIVVAPQLMGMILVAIPSEVLLCQPAWHPHPHQSHA